MARKKFIPSARALQTYRIINSCIPSKPKQPQSSQKAKRKDPKISTLFSMRPYPISLLLLTLLTACAPTLQLKAARTPALNLSGPAPDVIIIGVSGHCPPLTFCWGVRDNYDYLTHHGTLDRLAQPLEEAGLHVQVAGYASGPFDQSRAPNVSTPQRGWLALRRDYLTMNRVWAADPPRVIMVGHSHGVAWLHALARQTPERKVDVQIDLDAICAMWQFNYLGRLSRLPAAEQGEPSITQACTPQPIAGDWVRGKDIVWDNVERSFEVQSMRPWNKRTALSPEPWNPLWEVSRNVRPDGSRRGIVTAQVATEDHSQVARGDSQAIRWVAGELGKLAQQWR